MLCRLICLARGLSGVTVDLLRHLAQFLNAGITPLVPSLGSVGASGDLTPLSYIAACLSGKRDVLFGGEILPAAVALERIGMQPYRFAPKEPLGLMNGTSVMTGIAVIAVQRSKKLLNAAIAATALAVHALEGHVDHFHAVLVDAKPHFGQKRTGERLRAILASAGIPQESIHHEHLQDPYSIRCAPQILGVVADALEWIEA
jgi:histidine ammonia-lyase